MLMAFCAGMALEEVILEEEERSGVVNARGFSAEQT
jgi:hypothetical protein